MKNKKYAFLIPFLLCLFMSLGLVVGHFLTLNYKQNEPDYSLDKIQKLKDIFYIIDKKYVDPIDKNQVFEKSLSSFLHNLDPHSNYISADKMKGMTESIEGNFGGVGLRFFILRDTICVSQIISNTPSMRAGLKSGDKIIKIDGQTVAGKQITNEKVMSLLKGKAQTRVKVEVLRNKEFKKFDITRGNIPIESVVASYITGDIGYIKIDQFTVKTAREFHVASSSLLAKGMKKMILDLRNNGGGVLQSATKIVDEFLPVGKIIVKTKGKNDGEKTYSSLTDGRLKSMPLIVLINENSASASEILAGSLQDNDRGLVIGRRSFGKGLVQEDIKLRDGSMIRLTIARYYTPTGRCIQRPYDNGLEEYYDDNNSRWENGELYHVDSSLFVDSLKFTTAQGKVVYGGGGIMPDVFVPFDSSGRSLYYTNLSLIKATQSFSFDYVADKRSKWNSFKEFNRTADAAKILKSFVLYANKNYQLNLDFDEINRGSNKFSNDLKSEIARQLWVEQGYYFVNNKQDNVFLKAIQLLTD